MRKQLLFLALIFSMLTANAQYKKASFFKKTGTIYDFGVSARVQSSGRSTAPGFFMSFGKQNSDKFLSHWFDFELTLGSDFKYTSTSTITPTQTLTVNGKSRPSWTIRYNLVHMFSTGGEEDSKLLPFINAAIGYLNTSEVGMEYTTDPPNDYPKKYPVATSALTYGGGAGIVYMITSHTGIRFSAAYYAMTTASSSGDDVFESVASHPSFSLALRIRMVNN